MVRHLKQWLKAGVLEAGEWQGREEGTPQGQAHCLRIATSIRSLTCGPTKDEAERFLTERGGRCRRFTPERPPAKTRLIEFGHFAAERRKRRGQGRPASFDFLGFTPREDEERRGSGPGQDDGHPTAQEASGGQAHPEAACREARSVAGKRVTQALWLLRGAPPQGPAARVW